MSNIGQIFDYSFVRDNLVPRVILDEPIPLHPFVSELELEEQLESNLLSPQGASVRSIRPSLRQDVWSVVRRTLTRYWVDDSQPEVPVGKLFRTKRSSDVHSRRQMFD